MPCHSIALLLSLIIRLLPLKIPTALSLLPLDDSRPNAVHAPLRLRTPHVGRQIKGGKGLLALGHHEPRHLGVLIDEELWAQVLRELGVQRPQPHEYRCFAGCRVVRVQRHVAARAAQDQLVFLAIGWCWY